MDSQMPSPQSTDRLLVVDDEVWVRDILSKWLQAEGYSCDTAASAQEAIERLRPHAGRYSLVVSDIMMPGLSGVDLLSIVHKCFPDVAVIMVTALSDRETALQTLRLGAYGYLIKPLDQTDLLINVANALERRRLVKLSEEHSQELERKVSERTADIERREIEVAMRLVAASDFRDEETGNHVRRIGKYAQVMARELGWGASEIGSMGLAAPMHDVGKIGVPDRILLKPSPLTEEEFESMKKHTLIGAQILGGSDISLLNLAEEIALSHHEKWDGSGYPVGLKGEAIPLSGRLVAVIDVYDSLVHDRVYRAALPEEEVLEIIKESSGTHFDPAIHQCFVDILPVLHEIRLELSETAEADVLLFERLKRKPHPLRVDREPSTLFSRR